MGWLGPTSLGVLRDALRKKESSPVVLAGGVAGPLGERREP